MKIYQGTWEIPGSTLKGENPQPRFREKNANIYCTEDGTLRPEEHIGYGVACNERTLPYRMQDRYDRSEELLTLETIVMENEYLKAVFLPGYGGKLWSLYSKEEERELLFVNPVFRFANLANRNAWMSGGIEWNLGHMGHHMLTSTDVYCGKVTAPDGEEFLRIYDYEAGHAQVLQMDFHLPDGAKQLAVHVRIQNARDTETPLYWWTNVAVPLTDDTRVFSSTKEVMYQLIPEETGGLPGFGHCQMPEQPNLPGVDLSYPRQIPHSLEYFFQNSKKTVAPWEISVEKDCRGFMERSTQPLRTRKMFCWGSNTGGRHWCDYLSKAGEGDYIELQAGVAPSQLHTGILPEDGVVSFTQFFGAYSTDERAQKLEWNEAFSSVDSRVEELLPAAKVQELHIAYGLKSTLKAQELLHTGTWYGGLEMARREKAGEMAIATHLYFPRPETEEYGSWLKVLEGQELPETSIPHPYMTDEKWLDYLKEAAENGNQETKFQYAVSMAENGYQKQAEKILEELVEKKNPWAAHTLALLYQRDKNLQEAHKYFMMSYEWEQGKLDVSFAEDALQSLLRVKEYEKAWALYEAVPEEQRTETEELLAAEAAVKLGKEEFLEKAYKKVYSAIREGAVGLADVWYEHQARKKAEEQGVEFSPEMIDLSLKLPRNLDFLMFRDDGKEEIVLK